MAFKPCRFILWDERPMILYELMILVSPDLDESSKNQTTKFIKDTFLAGKGEIVVESDLGKKELAFPIMGNKEANYLYFEVNTNPLEISAIDKKIRINESIIRYLLVKKDKVKKIGKKAQKSEKKVEEKPEVKVSKKKIKKEI